MSSASSRGGPPAEDAVERDEARQHGEEEDQDLVPGRSAEGIAAEEAERGADGEKDRKEERREQAAR